HGARGDTDTRRNQICIEAGGAGGRRDLNKIATRSRLPAGEVHLHDAQLRGFLEHPLPGRGVELVLAPLERQWIGAIGTTKRTPVRQLGKQADWGGGYSRVCHRSQITAPAISSRRAP